MENTLFVNPRAIAGLAFILSTHAALAAENLNLLPPQAGDLTVEQLAIDSPPIPTANTRRETVRFSWPLYAQEALDLRPVPHEASSKAYWFEADGAELLGGVPLEASAPGAVVRISPLASGTTKTHGPALDPDSLELEQNGKAMGKGAMENMVSAEQLAAAETPFPRGTTAFRVSKALGAGAFRLRSKEPVPADARYLIEVVDQHSDAVMTLRADSETYLRGHVLHASLALQPGRGRGVIESAEAFLISPGGKRYPVEITGGGDQNYGAAMALDLDPGETTGLWELHATLKGKAAGGPVRRHAKTAFAFGNGYARLQEQAQVERDAVGNLRVTLTAEASVASRYALRGVLYGSAGGSMRPIAIAETGQWLEPGQVPLDLEFNAEDMSKAGLGAPYELRHVQLVDQGRMSLQHRQARALVID